MKPSMKNVADQKSWVMKNNSVELAVTQLGGHMAPVTFYRDSKSPLQPYYIGHWHGQKIQIDEPVLRPLRGDFLCLPFAGGMWKGKHYIAHGQCASQPWTFADLQRDGAVTQLSLAMNMTQPKGRITKTLSIVDGHNVVYSQHLLEGFRGRYPLSHHATLRMPETQRRINLSTAPFALGCTMPARVGNPLVGEYDSIQPGQTFEDLAKVPTLFKDQPFDDLTSAPRMRGYVDVLGVFHPPSRQPAWTAAVFLDEGFAWFSFKDPAMLPCLSMWFENHGRWNVPWHGRNNCLGLEDGACFLPAGMGPSLGENPASRIGIPTSVDLSPKTPTAVNYIQGVVKVPKGFDRVRDVQFGDGGATFFGDGGKKAFAPVNYEFLSTGLL
ncbi:MAG TPA: hypothetical protein VIL86_11555 [Tepidisphaeraceae bacterium]